MGRSTVNAVLYVNEILTAPDREFLFGREKSNRVQIEKGKNNMILLTTCFSGADDQNRTGDLLITNQLLYRLSYIGIHY